MDEQTLAPTLCLSPVCALKKVEPKEQSLNILQKNQTGLKLLNNPFFKVKFTWQLA
jgi:hypothetical protein